ncbi:MAG TPA: DUF429 domain-containing protein [Actinophytocola sp.]|uniref:DUF429 domain-containing protein n=1 Tax=Actinophytocola sp. TaxID=1872138 RepID=UPI002DDD5C88|nr:DUF429 domain-containing protein [Actinophytocola sp.]HEV2778259.1 DUF429 domain-containing protein [Actinophytocola sp.]
MRTVGVDLAAEPINTAIAVIEWGSSVARVVAADLPGTDEVVLSHAQEADKVGIDCPLGWPNAFLEFLNAHHEYRLVLPDAVPSGSWRRSLAYRGTDEHVRSTLGITPLSVATDRIGITAMRSARLQVLLARHGHTINRAGSGLIVEVYPAAGLKHWALPYRRYKRNSGRGSLDALVDHLQQAAPWLHLGHHEQACRHSDHILDSVICALLARAAALNLTTPPPADQHTAAQREGWIAIPNCTLDQLAP